MLDEIRKLIKLELKNSIKKFSDFGTTHEGWALLKEEIEETETEIKKINSDFRVLKNVLETETWNNVKSNNYEELIELYEALYKNSEKQIAEMIQVSAMLYKNLNLLHNYKTIDYKPKSKINTLVKWFGKENKND